MRHSRWQGAALSGRVSRSRAMPVGGPHRENWPALQAVRAASSVGGTCGDGVIPTVGVSAAAALRAAVPGPTGRTARRSAFPCLPGHLSQWGPRRDGGHPDGWGMGRRGAARRCAGRRPALQSSSRLFSVCGARHSRWRDGASSELVSRSRAMPVGDRRSSRPRACSPSAVRGAQAGRMERHRGGFRAPARCRSETGAPVVLALVLGLRCAALTLAGRSVIGACFALPRDAGRRPALQSSPRLFSVCGTRHPPWRDGASSARVSRSRAMPVGDRRSWRFPACSATSGGRRTWPPASWGGRLPSLELQSESELRCPRTVGGGSHLPRRAEAAGVDGPVVVAEVPVVEQVEDLGDRRGSHRSEVEDL